MICEILVVKIVPKCNSPRLWDDLVLLDGLVVYAGWSIRMSTKPMWEGVLEGFGRI
jgi:hypothetical protein